jgi:hypothetical protein
MKIILDKFVAKIKTRISRSVTFFRKSCRLWYNVDNVCRAVEATDNSMMRRMRFVCWVTNATYTHSELVIVTAFVRQHWLYKRVSIVGYIALAVLFKIETHVLMWCTN